MPDYVPGEGTQLCFNLVIEMLVISGEIQKRRRLAGLRFNLVIEMLVISGGDGGAGTHRIRAFQSRNRDACHFRPNQRDSQSRLS